MAQQLSVRAAPSDYSLVHSFSDRLDRLETLLVCSSSPSAEEVLNELMTRKDKLPNPCLHAEPEMEVSPIKDSDEALEDEKDSHIVDGRCINFDIYDDRVDKGIQTESIPGSSSDDVQECPS